MLLILVAMLAILVVAGLILLYVAYPHRGQQVPNAAWLGDALRRGADRLPTLADPADRFGLDDRQPGREQADSRR